MDAVSIGMRVCLVSVVVVLLLGSQAASAQVQETLITTGAAWRYLDDGSDQGSAWAAPDFDDSGWAVGSAQLGYGDGDEQTVVSFGPDPANKYVTTYFRHEFSVADPAAYAGLALRLLRDDGAVVHLNGVEVFRSNMPADPIQSTTYASTAVSGTAESTYELAALGPGLLVAGTNLIAVEVHQSDATSSDVSFDLDLVASTVDQVTRGPYLQGATPTSIIVRWRTGAASDGRVRFGSAPDNLTQTLDDLAVTTDHEVELTGLTPDTTYYYAIGSTTETFAGADLDTFFVTPPAAGTRKPTRIWVVGDSGTADANARAVRDAYLNLTAGRTTDLWLMLGDNAYNLGTDAEYQAALFDTYPSILRQTPVWPTFGNHDAGSAQSSTQSGTYYDIFSLPADGAAGGMPSGTEAYYSFDYGNIHFVVLNSQDVDRSATSPMWTWLDADLASTARDWVIAYWHHPPYSQGSHNSDLESQLVEMREEALSILEGRGVDLVLSGHSHSYERSFLLDGHYGSSATFNAATMAVDAGDGRLTGDGIYAKADAGLAPHQGAVYVVAGSSGQISGGTLNHPAMFLSLNRLGSLVLDVDGPVLNARFVEAGGTVTDQFTIVKGDEPACIPGVLVPNGAIWRYLDDGSDPGTSWKAGGFNDLGWAAGPSQLGYGDGDEATVLGFGPDPANKYVTSYFRHAFNVADAGDLSALQLRLLRDDGAVVYLNGAEVLRSNMPPGPVGSATLAPLAIGGADETVFHAVDVDPSLVVAGANVLAVEVHQATPSSSDLSLDLELVGDFCVDPDLIFADGFESGNLSAWSSAQGVIVNAAAAMDGAYGLAVPISGVSPRFVQDNSPAGESSYRVKLALDPNSLNLGNNKAFDLLRAFGPGTSTNELLLLEMRKKGGRYEVHAHIRRDNNTILDTPWKAIADAPNLIELEWHAATAPQANNGSLTLRINGQLQASVTGVDNDTRLMDSVRLGAVSGIDNGTTGSFYLDAFESRR